ncbi:hypothetical protein K3495_g4557 [Podosphaera aphanis]|nr:hypothetical protein K3495_g4557 [Podosphaera aphanis]
MDSTKVLTLLQNLDEEIDDLKESLVPVLQNSLTDIASKHPLLDRAKLYIFVTYTIETILFSYLQLNGVKAREHPVFVELCRVKQYFEKIKLAEHGPAERNMTLDKGAAARFIKAGLAGNDKYDLIRAEQQAKEIARSHIRFDTFQNTDKKRKLGNDALEACADSDADQINLHNLKDGVQATNAPKTSEAERKNPSKKSKKRKKNAKKDEEKKTK